jgi:hypothetical protein
LSKKARTKKTQKKKYKKKNLIKMPSAGPPPMEVRPGDSLGPFRLGDTLRRVLSGVLPRWAGGLGAGDIVIAHARAAEEAMGSGTGTGSGSGTGSGKSGNGNSGNSGNSGKSGKSGGARTTTTTAAGSPEPDIAVSLPRFGVLLRVCAATQRVHCVEMFPVPLGG